jgi:prepilin-type N-terminal cleavage/methylation domain-containing protein
MVKRTRLNERGFSLAEMLITVAIVGMVLLVVPRLIINTVRFISLYQAKTAIQRDARAALNNINRLLRQAQSSSVVIDQVSNQAPHSRISFTHISGQGYQFYQSGTKLYSVGISTAMLTDNLRFITFSYPRTDDPTIISVAITMEKATYEGGTKALELSIEKVRVMN